MNSILKRQLALDYCCSEAEVQSRGNVTTVFRKADGQRRFDGDETCFLKILATNDKLLCCGREDVVAALSPWLAEANGRWFLDAAPLAELNRKIAAFGYRIKRFHPFFTSDKKSAEPERDFDLVWYEKEEIEAFRGDPRFKNAFTFLEAAPDMLGVAAVQNGEILGMAGASGDSPTMWQIGIDVPEQFCGRGIAPTLVIALKNEILERGVLPFYGTAASHMASQRVAVKSGFLPTWTELLTAKSE